MLMGSKHTSDPSSDARSSPLMRSSRATRSRSKSTRCSQSTPIKPNVLPIASTPPRAKVANILDLAPGSGLSLPERQLNGGRVLGRMAVEAALDVIDRHFAAENAHDV